MALGRLICAGAHYWRNHCYPSEPGSIVADGIAGGTEGKELKEYVMKKDEREEMLIKLKHKMLTEKVTGKKKKKKRIVKKIY